MPTNLRLFAAVIIGGAIAWGCVGSTAPKGSIPTAEQSQVDPFGAWIRVEYGNDIVEGELISVASESLFVMTDKLIVLGRDSINDLVLTRWEQEHAAMTGWTVLGTVASVSHGFFLVGTVPIWIVTGSLAAGKASREPIVHPKPSTGRGISIYELQELAPYARFPQGLPRDLDRAALRTRQP